MDAAEAYAILTEEIELNRETADAFDYILHNEDECRDVVKKIVDDAVTELATEENPVAISQIVRRVFNATHRTVHGKIISITGVELTEPVNDIVREYVRIAQQAEIQEEYCAAAFVACSETSDVAYA